MLVHLTGPIARVCPRSRPHVTIRSGWIRISGVGSAIASPRPRTSIPRGRHGIGARHVVDHDRRAPGPAPRRETSSCARAHGPRRRSCRAPRCRSTPPGPRAACRPHRPSRAVPVASRRPCTQLGLREDAHRACTVPSETSAVRRTHHEPLIEAAWAPAEVEAADPRDRARRGGRVDRRLVAGASTRLRRGRPGRLARHLSGRRGCPVGAGLPRVADSITRGWPARCSRATAPARSSRARAHGSARAGSRWSRGGSRRATRSRTGSPSSSRCRTTTPSS